jgi:beta-ureidopropionase / N-carbamoyl-L-amino-acid hydrolase
MKELAEKLSGLRIDRDRLMARIFELGNIGALDGGGVCRLALGDEDRQARDLVISWMRDLDLDVSIDRIGNILAVRPGTGDGLPVTIGSHIDSVATGGLYDGALGVLAGLEIIETLRQAEVNLASPVAVAAFTNEEGARFAPDMMGSGVHQGALDLAEMLAVQGIDGITVGDALDSIGYVGPTPVNSFRAAGFFELHVEQGPVLEEAGLTIGAVTGVQGISWTEFQITGVSNHAGTTPMRLRHDAGYVAAAIAVKAREIAIEIGGSQVATVGVNELQPNLVNVIADQALVTVDLRNTDENSLQESETRMTDFVNDLAAREGVKVKSRKLARFAPVAFDEQMVSLVESKAEMLGHSVQRLPSGAGHDAQMFAPNCPTAMIFVPSKDGISHNIHEHTDASHIEAGANVLLQTVLARAN